MNRDPMSSPPLSWIQYKGRGYRKNQISSTRVAISSVYLFWMGAVSGQLDPLSMIFKAQICTIFICVAQFYICYAKILYQLARHAAR